MTTIRLEMETDAKITPDYTSPDDIQVPSNLSFNCISSDNGKNLYEVFTLIGSPANKNIEAYVHEFLKEVNSYRGLFEADEETVYDIMEDIMDLLKDPSCFETNFFRLYGIKLGIFVAKCAWALEFADSHECKFFVQIFHD